MPTKEAGNIHREDPPTLHRVHDPNEPLPLPGKPSGQQQFEVRYSDKNPS